MTAARRVVVADDEPLARDRLRFLLDAHPSYHIVAEAADGDDALDAIERHRPDLAFLDIRMPGRDGVQVAQSLADRPEMPMVVFVTAHDEFALRAFEVSAMDYLVKPVDRERFDRMLQRVERRMATPGASLQVDELRALVQRLQPAPPYPPRFVVRSTRGHYFVRTDTIESATAEGNYVALASEGRIHLVRETMKSLETKLDPAAFLRIHRSVIVSIDRIARVEPLGHGACRVIMKSGARFESSPSYGRRIQELLR